MLSKRLPRELISLIHHIELNKAGWWDRAIQQLILFVIWLNNNHPMSTSDILNILQKEFDIILDNNTIQHHLKYLIENNKIIHFNNGFKLSESSFLDIEKRIKETETVENNAKKKFLTLLEDLCPSLDPSQAWSDFNDTFLVPFVSQIGAYAFHLVTGEVQVPELEQLAMEHFTTFTSKYSANVRAQLREVVVQFLNPKDISVRQHILRIMNAYFYVEAFGLKSETLQKLLSLSQKKPEFIVFVDTNFLFSILNLHDNPSNEAAAALMELIKKLPRDVTVKFYVSQLTLDEARRVLVSVKSSLEGIRITPNLARSASFVEISGIQRRYFDACAKNPSLDAESFFRPYIDGLLEIIRTQGVELYNQRLDEYKRRQDVIDDILEQLEQQSLEERRFGTRAKSYEALEHDMALWHFVKDKRSSYVESPLEATYWIVTVDYRFLGFDRRKSGQIPICIHPTALAQMLQFWIPRTDTLEEALLATLRLAFFFSEFDPEAEKVTLTILKTLSRFENIEDLPVETVTNILLNESLREKIRATPEEDKQVQLIKEALIDEQARLKHALEEKESELEKVRQESGQKQETIRSLQRELDREKRLRQSLENQLQQIQKEVQALREERQLAEKRRMQRRFVIQWVIALLVASLTIGFLTSMIMSRFIGWDLRALVTTLESFVVLFWLWQFDRAARKRAVEHPVVDKIRRFKRWIFVFLGGVIAGAVGNALYELIKTLWS